MANIKQTIFLGTELKLNVNIEKIGDIAMDDYDFTVSLYCSTSKAVVVPKQDAIRVDDSNYIVCADTTILGAGKLKCRVEANLPDGDFSDQLRTEVMIIDTGIEIVKTL